MPTSRASTSPRWSPLPVYLVLGALIFLASCADEPSAKNVILISVDTLRSDRLGAYGYPVDTSPSLDRLAADGVLFTQAISHSPWTTPSHMSLMTSLVPSSHTVTQGWLEFLRFQDESSGYRILPRGVPTLAESLSEHGYSTLAMTGGGTVGAALGFDRGFDVYEEDARFLTPEVWARLAEWLTARELRPFFLFFHTFEVHAPYTHTEYAAPLLDATQEQALEDFIRDNPSMTEAQLGEFLQNNGLLEMEITSRLYDGGIRYTDRFLGHLFELLKSEGLWDETIILVVSDHGEEFADHRPEKFYNVHCDTLYDELVRVPLILRAPGRFEPGQVVGQQVRLVDVAPTVLDLLEIPVPAQMQGVSLVSRIGGSSDADSFPLPAVSEALCIGPEWKSLRTDRYKYIVGFQAQEERVGIPGVPQWERLFDLRKDPHEHQDLSPSEQAITQRMRQELLTSLQQQADLHFGEEQSTEVTREVKEKLRALGYIQ